MRVGIKGTDLNTLLIFIKGIVHPKMLILSLFAVVCCMFMLYKTCINLHSCPDHKRRYFE